MARTGLVRARYAGKIAMIFSRNASKIRLPDFHNDV